MPRNRTSSMPQAPIFHNEFLKKCGFGVGYMADESEDVMASLGDFDNDGVPSQGPLFN